MIVLKKVNIENFWDIVDITVTKEQEKFVVSNAVSIAQAYVQPECKPLAVYNDDILVGFIMYCIDREDNEYWIYRFMIDKNYQNKGYGKSALEQVIEIIKKDSTRHNIYLGVHMDSVAAVHLYKSKGFEFDGQVFGEEHIMKLVY